MPRLYSADQLCGLNMPSEQGNVAVIVAAWNAQATITRAIQSALIQPEVSEVIVVNDGSTDETEMVVRAAIASDPRVLLFSTNGNKGPAAARNLAIAHSQAEYIAVLDADDFLLPARFSKIFKVKGWDAIADNIAFVPEEQAAECDQAKLERFAPDTCSLNLAAFIAGNIARPGKQRAELGFIKPVIRRQFLAENGIRYDETLKLGEDFAFYGQMLSAGARFLTLKTCGYVAVERIDSLSVRHRTEDLAALLEFCRKFERASIRDSAEADAIHRHRTQLEGKLFHRKILDVRKAEGRFAALLQALANPRGMPTLTSAVLRDKLYRLPPPDREVRYLF